MKTKLVQLAYCVIRIDPRYIRLAYFAFTVIAVVVMKKPVDGGTDPI
jgi:hypothetical protein